MDTQNLISTLIQQHRELQKNLGSALNFSLEADCDITKISQSLTDFKNNLTEHVQLEDGTLYKQLLEKMKDKGLDTTKTELFIKEMGVIAQAVMAFLNTYADNNAIENGIVEFRKTLPGIINTLNLRIESEESGVYSYWLTF